MIFGITEKKLTVESAKSSIFSMKNPFILYLLWKKKLRMAQQISHKRRIKSDKNLAEKKTFLNTFFFARALAITEGSRGVSEWVSKK